MKTLAISAAFAAALFSTAAHAQTDLSDRNGGLAKRVMCSNVPAQNGSVPGFYIPLIGWFVDAHVADRAAVEAFVLPAGISSKDEGEVIDYLHSVGLTNFELVISTDRSSFKSVTDDNGSVTRVTRSTGSGEWCR